MQTLCPNCRHSYQNEIHSVCPCYGEKVKCTMPVVLSSTIHLPSNHSTVTNCKVNINATYDISLTTPQRLRNILSGGTIVCNNSQHDKTDKSKSSKESHSPTAPLSFLLPSASLFASCRAFSIVNEKLMNSLYNSEEDLKCIAESQRYLKMSGWYHQQLTWREAIRVLMPTAVGTFLVRDSSDCEYLYSLSVQTKCGPTSIRIHYSKGEFRLDTDKSIARYMPKFPCIIKLIQFYIDSTKKLPLKCAYDDDNQIWIDCLGLVYSTVVVSKPLYAKGHIPSLKHLSRLCINRNLVDANLRSVVPAPSFVSNYLQEYPYKY